MYNTAVHTVIHVLYMRIVMPHPSQTPHFTPMYHNVYEFINRLFPSSPLTFSEVFKFSSLSIFSY